MMSFLHFRKSPVPVFEPATTVFPELRGAEIAACCGEERTGGDLYDSLRVSPTRVLFGLLDVAGRREDNEGILVKARQVFRELGAELLAPEEVNESDAMTELCLRLNRTIMEAAGEVHSCPAFAGCYHEVLGTVCYVNAGHTPGLLRDDTGGSELGATGLPLGLFSHVTCDAPTVAIEPGATLLLASRGVVEAECKGEEFGLKRLEELLQKNAGQRAQAVCNAVIEATQGFSCRKPARNDLTALALVRERSADGR
jgi:serine phosphatase RsbU (regulator of sigma subunit)